MLQIGDGLFILPLVKPQLHIVVVMRQSISQRRFEVFTMMENNVKANRQLKALARSVGAAALLLLYVMGSTQTGYLHQLFHPEEVAAPHSLKQEEDPCHRTLYHGMDTGCRHEVHLVKVHSCGLSHTLVQTELLIFESPASTSIQAGRECIVPRKNCCTIDITNTFLTRGPPAELRA